MDKITLVFIVSTLGRTGPTRQLYNIIKYLNPDLFDSHIVTLSSEPADTLIDIFSNINVDLHSLHLSRFKGIFFCRRRLSNLLRLIQPDIIHTHGVRADLYSAGANRYRARFTTQRNLPKDDYPYLFGAIVGSIIAWVHIRALKRIPYVIVPSSYIAKSNLLHGIITNVIHNGVDLSDYSPPSNDQLRIRTRKLLEIPEFDRIFVYSGPLIKRKNPDLVIRAFRDILEHMSAYLILLGDGPMLAHCRQLADRSPRIIFKGQVNNVSSYLGVADVFVSASYSEGMPNAVLEALASGLPVVLSDIPSHREILKRLPNSGLLFKSGDIDHLRHVIQFQNIAKPVRAPESSLIEAKFDAKSMSESYQNKYIQALQLS